MKKFLTPHWNRESYTRRIKKNIPKKYLSHYELFQAAINDRSCIKVVNTYTHTHAREHAFIHTHTHTNSHARTFALNFYLIRLNTFCYSKIYLLIN